MQTLFLGREQVDAYLRDLERRLLSLRDKMPAVWVPLGYSGATLLNEVFLAAPHLSGASPAVLAANCGRDPRTKAVTLTWSDAQSPSLQPDVVRGKLAIAIDSAVHSGSTMAAAVRELYRAGASGVCSYSLILKESSSFVPNYWAVSLGDDDRAYFLLDRIPNNRFVSPVLSADDDTPDDEVGNALPEALKGRLPYFTIRKLLRSDVDRPKFEVELKSLNRSTWADLLYQQRNSASAGTYVLEIGAHIVAYLSLDMPDAQELSIEQVATDPRHAGQGYAPALLRWAETLARLKDCRHIRLWAVSHREGWYLRHGFRRTPEDPLDLGDEQYVRMRKCLLPHTRCCPDPAPQVPPPSSLGDTAPRP